VRPQLRTATLKRAPSARSVGRLRLDAAAELLRLEFERARLAALQGRLSTGLKRAEREVKTAEARIGWLIDILGKAIRPGSPR